jgi:sugar lactone lactonase YvrE
MRQGWRGIAGLLAVAGFAAGGSVALASNGGNGNGNGNRGNALATTVFTMPAVPDGNPEGIAADGRSGRFFVSRVGTGAIFSGTLGTTALSPFIARTVTGTPPVATGMKVRKGLLYVAGATTGQVRVYNLANPTAAPLVFDTHHAPGVDAAAPTFINDLDVTKRGDVFATDSFQQFIYKIPAAAVASGTTANAVQAISVAPEIPYVTSADPTNPAFNLNGIVASGDGNRLTTVQTANGKLWSITFGGRDRGDRDHHARQAQATTGRTITEIAVQGGDGDVTGGDGLLVDRGRLLVVRGATKNAAKGAVDAFKVSRHGTRARFESETTDPSLSGPSTIARVRNRLLVVNASFGAGPTNGNFTVTGLARNAIRHGGHGGGRHGRG